MSEWDVLVAGGGPAGCSVALFTARYGLSTVVVDRGPSSLQQCAFVENYLGFPGGIDVETFAAMTQEQVRRRGATFVEDTVTDVQSSSEGFEVETAAGAYATERVVAATPYDVSYLWSVLGEHLVSDDGETWIDPGLAGDRGGTPVDGLWLAGPVAGVESQIAVAVGHGARVGTAVVESYRREVETAWELADAFTDWVVPQGRYGGEEWLDTATDWYREAAPNELDDEVARRRARELARQRQDRQIDDEEVSQRRRRAHRELLAYIDDDAILAAAAAIRGERPASDSPS